MVILTELTAPIQGAWALFGLLKTALTTLTILSVAVALIGLSTPPNLPFTGFADHTILGDYIVGFPECAASIGPVEFCVLPSLSMIKTIALPVDNFKSLLSSAANALGATDTGSGASGSPDFVLSLLLSPFVLVLDFVLTFLSLILIMAKIMIAADAGYAFITASSQYRQAVLNW